MRTLFDSSSGAAAIEHATPQAASESPGSGAAAIEHATPQAAKEPPFFLRNAGNPFVH
jgi:hypothetical protein